MLIFKLSSEYAYWVLLTHDIITYSADFSLAKYINGLICCSILFIFIKHDLRKPSSFMLYFKVLFEIVPLTIIYALANESALYYNCICLAFLFCEFLVRYQWKDINKEIHLKKIIITLIICLLLYLIVYILKYNGLPKLTALNIYNVYEIRKDFKINKYMGYILRVVMAVFIPLIIAKYICKKIGK